MKRTIIDIANEYVTQNNRGTAFPIAYICIEKKRIYREDGELFEIYEGGESISFDSYDDKEILEMVLDYNDTHSEEQIQEAWDEVDCGYGLEQFIETYYSDEATFHYYDLEYNYEGKQMFLTESSAKAHIIMNGHNMSSPKDYGIHVFRNIDMEIIVQDLMSRATTPKDEWGHEALHYYNRYILEQNENR